MLVRIVIFASLAAVLATQVPALFDKDEQPAGKSGTIVNSSVSKSATQVALPQGSMRLKADAQGHYFGDFKFNGKPVRGVIDTGATYVAINESLARRLGYGGNQLDFRYTVNTANGQAKVAHIMLDRIEIGTIRVRNVDAMVSRDEALSDTLVGVSFLNKLASYSVIEGTLNLKQ